MKSNLFSKKKLFFAKLNLVEYFTYTIFFTFEVL